jgi:hypothetical protein
MRLRVPGGPPFPCSEKLRVEEQERQRTEMIAVQM